MVRDTELNRGVHKIYKVGVDGCDQTTPFVTTCMKHHYVYHFETLEDAQIMCTDKALKNQEDLCFLLCAGVEEYGLQNPVIRIHGDETKEVKL